MTNFTSGQELTLNEKFTHFQFPYLTGGTKVKFVADFEKFAPNTKFVYDDTRIASTIYCIRADQLGLTSDAKDVVYVKSDDGLGHLINLSEIKEM